MKKTINIDKYQDILDLNDADFLLVAAQIYNAGIKRGICVMSDAHTIVRKLKLLQDDIDALIEHYDISCLVCEDEDNEEVPLVFDQESD